MTAKTPIRTVFNESGTATGLAEFQTGEFIAVEHGGLGVATLTANAILLGNGTSAVQNSAIGISGTTLSSTDSSLITIDEGLTVTGNLTVSGTITGTVSGSSTAGNIQIGVTGNNEIDTASGNLTIDSAGGTVTVDDNLSVSGNATITGDLTVNGTTTTVNSTTIEITNSFTFEGSTADANETVLGVVDPTADRTINLPDASGTIVLQDTTDTLTNKTINLTSNTLTGTTAQFNSALSDGSFVTLAGSETLTNKTLTTPVISSISNTGTITLPTSTDTLVGRATTDTLTNKTIDADNNTLSNIGDSELSSGISATKIGNGDVDNTELSYLNGVTSAIQTQIDTKASTAFAIAQAVALG
jgi:hypothetical protein